VVSRPERPRNFDAGGVLQLTSRKVPGTGGASYVTLFTVSPRVDLPVTTVVLLEHRANSLVSELENFEGAGTAKLVGTSLSLTSDNGRWLFVETGTSRPDVADFQVIEVSAIRWYDRQAVPATHHDLVMALPRSD
jgi:hypothetical protein